MLSNGCAKMLFDRVSSLPAKMPPATSSPVCESIASPALAALRRACVEPIGGGRRTKGSPGCGSPTSRPSGPSGTAARGPRRRQPARLQSLGGSKPHPLAGPQPSGPPAEAEPTIYGTSSGSNFKCDYKKPGNQVKQTKPLNMS